MFSVLFIYNNIVTLHIKNIRMIHLSALQKYHPHHKNITVNAYAFGNMFEAPTNFL